MDSDGGRGVPVARGATEEELFLLDWIKDVAKGSYATLVDVLKQLVTINSAFVGTLIVFADKTILRRDAAYALAFAFIAAAMIAFLGLVPDRKSIPFSDVDQIRKVREAKIRWKYWCMLLSACLMLAALVLAFAFSLVLGP